MIEELRNRILQRLETLGISAGAASLKAGMSRDFVRSFFRTEGYPSISGIAKLAYALETTPEWLAYGAGDGQKPVPLISWVQAGGFVHPDTVHRDDVVNGEHILVSDLGAGDHFALRVVGDSMNKIAPDSAIIIVNRQRRELVDNAPYIFAYDHGAVTFKRWRANPPRLEPYSFNPEFETIFPDENTRVIGRVHKVILDLD